MQHKATTHLSRISFCKSWVKSKSFAIESTASWNSTPTFQKKIKLSSSVFAEKFLKILHQLHFALLQLGSTCKFNQHLLYSLTWLCHENTKCSTLRTDFSKAVQNRCSWIVSVFRLHNLPLKMPSDMTGHNQIVVNPHQPLLTLLFSGAYKWFVCLFFPLFLQKIKLNHLFLKFPLISFSPITFQCSLLYFAQSSKISPSIMSSQRHLLLVYTYFTQLT